MLLLSFVRFQELDLIVQKLSCSHRLTTNLLEEVH